MTTAVKTAPYDAQLSAFAESVGSEGPVAVKGNQTRWSAGGELDDDTTLHEAPTGIVAYSPEEMTVRVRAGTSAVSLAESLAEAGQRTALPQRGGTVGGAVAVGEDHLEIRGRGSVTGTVLQVRYVSSEGKLVTGGGPVVKNVTGFDLPKLIVGSLGTLGLIGEVVLRTNPTPETSVWMRATECGYARALEINNALLRPGAILWDGDSVWILLEGHPGDVKADRDTLSRYRSWEEIKGPPPLPPHRWSLDPSALVALDAEDTAGRFVASVGVGTVWRDQPQPPRKVDPGVAALCRRVKQNFDPTGRLAPGRDVLNGAR